jgi:hypothetical protein
MLKWIAVMESSCLGATKKARAYNRVTAEECRQLAQLLRESLTTFEFAPNPTSDLARMMKALEWLGSFPSDAYQPDAAFAVNRARSMETFRLLEQAKRTTEALRWARTIPGSQQAVFKLDSRLNRLIDQDASALDFFFELDIAFRLAMRGLLVSFDEPDLVLTTGTERVGLACKRPRNLRQMRKSIRVAKKQVLRQPFPGFILINVEAMLHKSGDPQKPTVTYHVPTPEQLGEIVNPMIDEWVGRARPEIQEAFADGIWGVLFCGIVTGIADRAPGGLPAIIWEWFRRPHSNPSFPNAAEFLDAAIFSPLDAQAVA